jgi:trigger factor
VSFDATVRALSRRDVPAFDDAFASEHTGAQSVEELRQRVRADLEATVAREAESAVRGALVAKLVGAHEFDVPQAMVERRAEAMVEDVLESLGPRRPAASREPEVRRQLQQDLQAQARDHVKAALLLESVAAQEHLSVDEAELDAHVDRLAASAGKARERVRGLYQDAGARAGLRNRLLQERAIDLLVQRAAVTDVDAPSGVAGVPGNG